MDVGDSKKLPLGNVQGSNFSNGIDSQDLDFNLQSPGQAAQDTDLPWADSGPVDFSSPPFALPTNQLTTSTTANYSSIDNVIIKQSPSSPLAPIHPGNYYGSPRGPSWSARPYSLPLNAGTAFANPFDPTQPVQRPRPYSMIGTEHDPFRATFNQPTLLQQNPFLPSNVVTPAFGHVDPPQDLDDIPLADYTPGPPSSPNARYQLPEEIDDGDDVQDGDETSIKDEVEDDDEEEDIQDGGELLYTPSACPPRPGQTVSAARTTGQRSNAVKNFPGFPSYSADPPEDLSCYEVCQQYPASVRGQNLLPFLQRRWSAEEIFSSFPSDVQRKLLARPIEQKIMYMYKRLQAMELRLKRPDYTQYLNLMNAENLRADGRPDSVTSLQSVQSPNETWRVRHRTGVDPQTRRYVRLPGVISTDVNRAKAQARANCPELLNPVPFNLDSQPPPVPTQPSTSNPSTSAPPSSAPRPRTDRRRKPRTATKSTTKAQSHSTSTSAPATTTAPKAHAQQHTSPSQSTASNASNDRIPTLESIFPSGMINVPGAYVRTLSPGGTRIWHGAPSPEFVDSWFRQGNRRFWLDVSLPDGYVPSPSPPPASAAASRGPGLAAAELKAVDGSKKRKAGDVVGEDKDVEFTALPDQDAIKVKRARIGKAKAVPEDDDDSEIERLLLRSVGEEADAEEATDLDEANEGELSAP